MPRKISSFYPVLERLIVLSVMDLKLKYQNGVLGFFWSFFKPLIQFVAYYFVFGVMLKIGKDIYYPLELFLGILIWSWFAESTFVGLQSFINKKSIVTQIAINKLYPPIAAFLAPTMNYLLNVIIFLIAYLFFTHGGLFEQTGYSFFTGMLILLQAFLTLSLIIFALNILLAYANARYRDVQMIWELVLMYGIFLTPIFYALPIPADYQALYFMLNPIAWPILLMKSVFFPITLPHLTANAYCLQAGYLLFILGMSVICHKKSRTKIADFI